MLPSRLAYQTKIEPAAAKSYRSNIAPQNGTSNYGEGDTIIFNLPTRNNLVFVPTESYLKFTPTITTSEAASIYHRFDSMGAHGFIRKIKVFHGSNVLEEIDNYDMLAKLVFDMQASDNANRGKLNILAGTNADFALPQHAAYTATLATLVTELDQTTNKVSAINHGALLRTSGTQNDGYSFDTNTYCLNLISIIGTLCNEKYFPLFACTAAPIRVEITLVPNLLNAVCTDKTGTFVLDNVEFVMNTIELSDSAMSIINNSLAGQPLQFTVSEWRNQIWNGSVPTGGTSFAVPLPFKFSSIKSILIATRDNTNGVGTKTYFPCSSLQFLLSSYYFRIGPNTIPSKAPTTTAEFFAEALKAMGSMSDIHYTPAIDYNSYEVDTLVACNETTYRANTTQSGSFYVGLDLENYATADRTSIFAGYNSNTEDIFYYPTYPAQTAVNIRFDAFCMFDTVLKFENSTCYAMF